MTAGRAGAVASPGRDRRERPATPDETETPPAAAAAAAGAAGEETDSPVRPGRQRRLLTVTLMICMGVVALEGTVVTTALPSVVGELQGLTLYPWVFSVYLLTSTTSVPVYGKLADVYGRKPLFLAGLSIFLLG